MGIPDEEQYGSAAELVLMHMVGCAMLCQDQLADLNQEKQKLYLAFELGVLEHYHRTRLIQDKSKDASQIFFEFLIFYGNTKYQNEALPVLEFWRMLAVGNLMHDERKLGFDSVNNRMTSGGSRRDGHAPPIYFMKALHIDF